MTRLASVGEAGQEVAAVIVGDRALVVMELPGCAGLPRSLRALIAGRHLEQVCAAVAEVAPNAGVPVSELRLGPPITDPGKIIAIGLNYRSHADEQGVAYPQQPLMFAKLSSALTGAHDVIRLPASDPECVDYEVELAVVIGREARAVAAKQALEVVAGYTVANDVTQRRWQKNDGQWTRAKGCDTFLPCGPWMVTADAIADHRELRVTTELGGETVQDALVSDLIHGVPELIAAITADITLYPGDIICTGTPAGVGCWRKPKRFLQPGDRVRCAIDGIGMLDNLVVAS